MADNKKISQLPIATSVNTSDYTVLVDGNDSTNKRATVEQIMAASGGGTVTSVAASGSNGVTVSGSPVTASGTIAIGLGAITPTSMAASGAVSGSNLSGTNTGDQTITLTGAVTGSGTGSFATTLAAGAVTNAKLADMTGPTVKGRTNGTGAPTDVSMSSLNAMLPEFVPDTGSGGTKGLVIPPGAGDAAGKKFLRADGTWEATDLNDILPTQAGNSGKVLSTTGTTSQWISTGSGSVTSVNVVGDTNVTASNGPITTAGTINIALANTAVSAGSYGSTTAVGAFTVDAKGRLTSASSTNIAFPVTSVAGKTGVVTLSASDVSGLSTVATTGAYADLSGKPTLGTAAAENVGYFATAAQGTKADTAVQPGSLATVATTGAYSDLSGKPTLGTIASQDASNVTITGGSITGITDLAVADGGTGAGTASGARVNLLPSYASNGGKILAVNSGASDVEWISAGGSGTVTSVDVSGGTTGLTTSGGPITGAGTITLAGTLAVANGGTGSTTQSGARTGLGLGTIATQDASNIAITGGSITGITDLAVSDGGTGASTLTGYVKGNGTSAFTASATVPSSDITGLGTMSTQSANSVAITGGSINGTTIGASSTSSVSGTQITSNPGAGNLAFYQTTGRNYLSGTYGTVGIAASAAVHQFYGSMTEANSNTHPRLSLAEFNAPTITAGSASVTDAATVYISDAPNASGANNYALWVPAGAVNFGGALTAGSGTINGTSIPASSTLLVSGGALGTPSSGTLTSCTGLPVSTGISGLGTSVATALAVNVGSSGAFVVNGGALGTPSSGTVTNLTGTASININGTVGATTANTGAFTTLSASSTVSGTGFSTYLASPPAIGGTAAAAGTFTTLTDSIGNVRIIPQNSQSAAYTLVLADGGKHILHPSADTTARTFTIPANGSVAFPIGTAVTFVNQASAGTMTIAITTDTMRLAGAGTTGSRTLAANGIATAVKITSTEWIISGTGLT